MIRHRAPATPRGEITGAWPAAYGEPACRAAKCRPPSLSSNVVMKDRMSVYEARRWDDLEKHWVKKASRKEVMPAKVRAAANPAIPAPITITSNESLVTGKV